MLPESELEEISSTQRLQETKIRQKNQDEGEG
jgi:hypothetical protein